MRWTGATRSNATSARPLSSRSTTPGTRGCRCARSGPSCSTPRSIHGLSPRSRPPRSASPGRGRRKRWRAGSYRRDEAEAAGLAAALHALLVFHVGAHQSGDEPDVEPADLRVIARKVMIHAVLALEAGLAGDPGQRRGGHVHAEIEHELGKVVVADLAAQRLEQDARKPGILLGKDRDAGIGQDIYLLRTAAGLPRLTAGDVAVALEPREVLLDRASADAQPLGQFIDG